MVLSPPTALWVVPVSDLAGVARHVLDVARAGIPGWRLVFLTPPGDLPRELKAVGAAVLEQPIGPEHGVRASVASLRHAARTLRPSIVHSHLSYADIVAALAVRGPRMVTTEHGIAMDDVVYHQSEARSRAMAAIHAARLRRFDAVIAVSRATADAMRHKWHPPQDVVVIHNGVDHVEIVTPRAGLRILSLARLSPEKRLSSLVDGFAELHRTHPEARLTLAGTGPEETALREKVAHLGLEGLVDLPGFLDANTAMAAHDVLAMLSVWENCSYALLDACVHGMGVVASNVGGNREILPPRSLVRAEDPAGVAAALLQQGSDVDSRPRLTDWSSVDAMCERISSTYASIGRTR